MDKVWQQLTESEQRQFQKAMSSGTLGNLLSMYTPWWNVRVGGSHHAYVHVHIIQDIALVLLPFLLVSAMYVTIS